MNCRVCGESLHLICNFSNGLMEATRFLRHSRYPESITDNNEHLETLSSMSRSQASVLRRKAEVDCYYHYAQSSERSTKDILREHRRLTKQGRIPRR